MTPYLHAERKRVGNPEGLSSNRFTKPEVPESIKVFPSNELNGEVAIPGDKVSAVHLLLATAILESETKIWNIHYCGDVLRIIDWLKSTNLVNLDQYQEYLNIFPNKQEIFVDLSDLADTRSNICLVSALAMKHKKVIFKDTEGCRFTDRKIDRHFALIEAFGLRVMERDGLYEITYVEPSNSVEFDCSTPDYGPSVGVTCHALIASLVYKSKITLTNAALEFAPMTLVEYIEKFSNKRVHIDGRRIMIDAVSTVEHNFDEITLKPDITVASTHIAALVSTGKGELQLENICLEEIPASVLDTYTEMGIDIKEAGRNSLRIRIGENGLQMPKEVICDVFPAFPTDVAPIFAASVAGLNGTLEITDKIYNQRSSHVDGLNKMGFELTADGNKIRVNGHAPSENSNIAVEAVDIRSGAALIVGALGSNSNGVTITNYHQVYRGYSNLIEDLQKLGAKIECI